METNRSQKGHGKYSGVSQNLPATISLVVLIGLFQHDPERCLAVTYFKKHSKKINLFFL